MTISNNPVVVQSFRLLSTALTLKEKFDLKEDTKVLQAYLFIYNRELDTLKGVIPDSVISAGNLLRHSAFLNRYINSNQPESCYQDIMDICHTDIYVMLELFFRYLSENKDQEYSYYNWATIHPYIEKLARPRFEAKHFADAVEASLKEINEIVKTEFKYLKGDEEDGASLMRKAFGTNANNNFSPAIPLADNSTITGRNIQEGYMNIFAGVMIGIRNPKAHGNLSISQAEAWEKIMICSHLMRIWDGYKKL